MLKAYKYRIYPNRVQSEFLHKNFGAVRYVYNLALETWEYRYSQHKLRTSSFDLSKQLTDLKKAEGMEWMKECLSIPLLYSIRNLETGYKNFFESLKKLNRGQIEELQFEKPTIKGRYSKKSFQLHQGVSVDFEKSTVKLPKIEPIKVVFHRKFDGIIKTCTFSQNKARQYFVSILVETKDVLPELKEIDLNTTIGVDTGILEYVTTTDGRKFENKRHLQKSIKRLAILQKRESRKAVGSKNRENQRIKVNRLHQKIVNQRDYYIHDITHQLASDDKISAICVEDLSVKKMMKAEKGTVEKPNTDRKRKRILNRNLSDVSLAKFHTTMKYKCEWTGKNYLEANTFEMTNRTCNNCGFKKEKPLIDLKWICPKCGTEHDRNTNSSNNIKEFSTRSLK